MSKYFTYFLVLFFYTNSGTFCQDTRSQIDSANSLSNNYIASNLTRSINIFTDNIRWAESIGYEYGKAKALERLAIAYYLIGKYDKSSESVFSALNIFEKQHRINELAELYGSYGYMIKNRDLVKAKSFMLKGIRLAERNNLDTALVILYDNFGVLFEIEEKPDSAMLYYNKSINLKYMFSDSAGIPYSLNKIAGIYAIKEEYDMAFELLRLSDKYRNKEPGDFGRAENFAHWGDILAYKGDVEPAIKNFRNAYSLSQKISYTPLMQYSSRMLADLFEKKGDFKNAHAFFVRYSEIKDSLQNKETSLKIAELELSYETEKKDRLIAENDLKIRKTSQQLFYLAAAVIFLSLFAVSIYFFQKQKRKRIQKELELQSLLKHAELEKKAADEKLRISRELHDNIGSQLTFLISSLDTIGYAGGSNNIENKVKQLTSFGRKTINELRNTIWAIKNNEADLNQLVLKLNELKLEINNTFDNFYININNSVTSTVNFSAVKTLNIYRIVQEAVQNIIKHAHAGKAEIDFSENDSDIILEIKDNGKGFDAASAGTGNGLNNMKFRCEEAGGSFYISSSSEGTVITCIIPK